MKNLIYFIGIIVCFYACDEKAICVTSDCLEGEVCPKVDENCYSYDWGFSLDAIDDTLIKSITYNPNNQYEIAYIHGILDTINYTNKREVVIFNTQTNTYSVVQQSMLVDFTHIDWGNNDYILVSNEIEEVWKINTSNYQSTKVISDNFGQTATWSPDGEQWAYSLNGTIVILDKNDNIIKRIDENVLQLSWSPNGKYLAGIRDGYLICLNINNEKVEDLFSLDNLYSVVGITWSKNSKSIYWSDNYGINRINIRNKNAERIKKHCSNVTYLYPTIKEENTLLYVRDSSWLSFNGHYRIFEDKIVELNLNTCQEKVIEID